MHAREQFLNEIRKDYEQADKAGRKRLLDEAVKRTKLNRKYLIRKLNQPASPSKRGGKKRRRGREYGAALVTALVTVWEIFEYPCGQRLAPILQREVERLRGLGELRCEEEVARQLERVSARTIDRLLAREKEVRHLQAARNPSRRPLLYQRVPVKVASEWDTREVGNVQVDYVAHCGRSTGGEYAHTISTVDIASGWWEGGAILGRSQAATAEGLKGMRRRAPFRWKEIHPDNDSGLLNDLLYRYCRQERIALSRSRPYRKNDNAWVEQKNWTHVRKVVGYRRYDSTREVELLNEIWAVARQYQNYFQPVIKLESKTRVDGRIRRVYEKEPRTPYERLLASGQLSRKMRKQLQAEYESLNPAELHRQLQNWQQKLFAAAEAELPGALRRRPHGPPLVIGRRRGVGLR